MCQWVSLICSFSLVLVGNQQWMYFSLRKWFIKGVLNSQSFVCFLANLSCFFVPFTNTSHQNSSTNTDQWSILHQMFFLSVRLEGWSFCHLFVLLVEMCEAHVAAHSQGTVHSCTICAPSKDWREFWSHFGNNLHNTGQHWFFEKCFAILSVDKRTTQKVTRIGKCQDRWVQLNPNKQNSAKILWFPWITN